MRRQLLVISAALAACALPCAAQERPSSGAYIAPMVVGVRTDDDRAVDDEAAAALATGFAAHTPVEFRDQLFRGRFDGVRGDDLTLDAAGINALRVFRRMARVSPFCSPAWVHNATIATRRVVDRRLWGCWRRIAHDVAQLQRDGRALLLRLDARARYDDADRRPPPRLPARARLAILIRLGIVGARTGSRFHRASPAAARSRRRGRGSRRRP